MEIIPLHRMNEAQRRAAEARHALREVYDPQPANSACTGNCSKGRMCDCVPDIDADESQRMPEGGFIACALVAGCVALALLGAWLQWGGA